MYNKTIIAPIIAVLAFAVGAVFHISITEDLQAQIIEGVGTLAALGTTIYGIVKNHK